MRIGAPLEGPIDKQQIRSETWLRQYVSIKQAVSVEGGAGSIGFEPMDVTPEREIGPPDYRQIRKIL